MDNDQLRYFEQLIQQGFVSQDSKTSSENVQNALSYFSNGLDSVKDLLFIISETSNPYAFHFACAQLHHIFTDYIHSFDQPQRQEIRNILASSISSRSEWFFQEGNQITIETFSKLCARVWRLSWFDVPFNLINSKDSSSTSTPSKSGDDEYNPSLIELALRTLETSDSLPSIMTSISLLNGILIDMSEPVVTLTLSKQKKIANSFKEHHLLEIFLTTTSTIRKIYETGPLDQLPSHTKNVLRMTLDLILSALGFNYTGNYIDENFEDVGTIHLNSGWIEALKLLPLYFQIYKQTVSPFSEKALQSIVYLIAIKNVILKTEETKTEFLVELFKELIEIFEFKIGLNDPQNRHELCRLFVRLKNNYRLEQFMKASNSMTLLNQFAIYCCALFQSNETTLSTLFYIFTFWNGIAQGIQTINTPNELKNMIKDIVSTFIDEIIKKEDNMNQETFLDDKLLNNVLDLLPRLSIGINFKEIGEKLLNYIIMISQNYQQAAESKNKMQMTITDKKLSWLIHLTSSIVFSKFNSSSEEDYIDSQLISKVLNVLKMHDHSISVNGKIETTRHLEYALIYFISRFSKFFFTEDLEYSVKVLEEEHQLHTKDMVLNAVLSKIFMTMKIWSEENDIILESIQAFNSLVNGRISGKMMTNSEMIHQLINNHNEIDIKVSKRACLQFYKGLSKITFNSTQIDLFERFTNIFDIKFKYIENELNQNNYNIADIITSISCAMRGILASCRSHKTYETFYNWFYEAGYYSSVFHRSLKVFINNNSNWEATWSILRFVEDFTDNAFRRIVFSNTSPNGIKLFKSTSEILIDVSNLIFQLYNSTSTSPDQNLDSIYITMRHIFKAFSKLIEGDYCNYGVFYIYNDNILLNLLSSIFNLLFSIPLTEETHYPKAHEMKYLALSKICTFNFSELFPQDTQKILGEPSTIITLILELIKTGFKTRLPKIINYCSYSIESITSNHLSLSKRHSPHMSILEEHHYQILNEILFDLFDLILTEKVNSSFSLYTSLYCLVQLQPQTFELIREVVIKSQMEVSQEKGEKMINAFMTLVESVEPTHSKENQERFGENASSFRNTVKQFIDLNSYYHHIRQYIK